MNLIQVLKKIASEVQEKSAVGSVLQQLLQSKTLSDNRRFDQKHKLLRQLIIQHPQDFFIDSEYDNIIGLTHTGTGFKIHVPRHVIPAEITLNRFTPNGKTPTN